jgi:hypothetical protein
MARHASHKEARKSKEWHDVRHIKRLKKMAQCVSRRVGQHCIYAPYMAVCLVIALRRMPYVTIYIWFWSTLVPLNS